jgi:predicted enzyme related to lactoylglutathione lyase
VRLNTSRVQATIPAADLGRARAFYADVLGLTPDREMAGVDLASRTGGGTAFTIDETTFAGQAGHTIAQWHVDDIESEVRELRAKGVEFEVYDMPGVRWDDGIASLGGLGRAAWFRDSEGNIMCIDQEIPAG